jgi:hypothetical protein
MPPVPLISPKSSCPAFLGPAQYVVKRAVAGGLPLDFLREIPTWPRLPNIYAFALA